MLKMCLWSNNGWNIKLRAEDKLCILYSHHTLHTNVDHFHWTSSDYRWFRKMSGEEQLMKELNETKMKLQEANRKAERYDELQNVLYSTMTELKEAKREIEILKQERTAQDSSLRTSQMTKGEVTSKTTFQKSAKGPLAIYETAPDGKYVGLENCGRKDEPLGSWSLTRNIDGKEVTDYKFEESFIIRPGDRIKLWAKGQKPYSASHLDAEIDQYLGVGSTIITKLVNPSGEDRATLVQKTTYN